MFIWKTAETNMRKCEKSKRELQSGLIQLTINQLTSTMKDNDTEKAEKSVLLENKKE